ncbi:hypothetical protein [Candidatus Parabeggiatoa sp. HSG14]|uniref:hypothetical protein n=1 Tax=Candidatus Parabeggiatoa sp. HSG14 TaxID=3055593 RepID=UPI0025A6DDA9|nr:hypothetical protein [Thiotrichales bacterium HSG14]
MVNTEFIVWLLFLLFFAIFPIKPIFKDLLGFGKNEQQDTTPRLNEEDYGEKHYSQLYCPGDKKYKKIVKLSNNAKPIN